MSTDLGTPGTAGNTQLTKLTRSGINWRVSEHISDELGADCGDQAGASGVGCGPDRLPARQDGVGPAPGRTSIYRALVRNGLVSPGSGSVVGRIIGGGNGPGQWSCGRRQF